MATTSNMFLYSLTFSGTKEQQILTASGSRLTLLRPDANLGQVITIVSHDVFSIIRSVVSFRLAGSTKAARNRFSRVHLETFGNNLVADPKGRACIVASIEKNKFIYVLHRNVQAELTISSPLEAHRHGTLVLSLVALDVGYANPVFASLETDYSELDQDPIGQAYPDVELVYYELDLGLNHVVRKWSDPVDPTSSLLIQVPGGNDGPSGVLVCAEDTVTYRHSNQEMFRVPIPRRRGATEDPQRKRIIVSGVMHKLKGGADTFFFLLQTEDGDIFKVTFNMQEDSDGNLTGEVGRIKIKYFDTIPVSNSLCVLKTGFLFAACDFGDNDTEAEFSSDELDPRGPYDPIYFHPRPLENLTLVQTIDSLSPILDSKVVNLMEENTPQIYSVCGNGARSRFRMLKHGLQVQEVVASELPGRASAVWTTKLTRQDKYDTYIILASSNNTLIMSIGEEVSQVSDSGFLTSVTTLAIQQIGEDSLVQLHPKGIRHLHSRQINEWPVPQHRSIVATAANEQQIAIALSSGEIVYFEVDNDGTLAEYDEKKEMPGTVTCLSLGQIPIGRLRSSFLAIGCDDCTVRILSLDPESMLESKSVQALTAAPSALNIMPMDDPLSGGSGSTCLHIGLHSGVYIRTLLDEITGELTDTRLKFLGPKAIKLFQITIKGQICVLALSAKPWVGYIDPARGFMMMPLIYESLEWGRNFSSEQCEEGIIGIHDNYLRIFFIETLRDNMIQKSVPLTYTPRQLVKHPDQPYFYTIESENSTLAPQLRTQLLADPSVSNGDTKVLPAEGFGYPRGRNRWASCINVIEPLGEEPRTLQRIDLEDNEAAVSAAVVSFASQDGESFLVVGTAKDMVLNPRQFSAGYICIYRFREDGKDLEFIHKTKVEEPPMALLSFQGRLAAGISKVLRIYDLGLKQLLRKTQATLALQHIVSLLTQGSRIIVGDVQQGITMVVYKQNSNLLIPFVDDSIARWTTCTTLVDYETVAGGDNFGNIWIVRCPENTSAEADDPGSEGLLGREHLHGAPNRLTLMAHFFTQDVPTSIHKTNLAVGGQDILIWTGLQGTIGVLIPSEDPPLTGRDHLMYRGYYVPVKGIIDGDLCERYMLLPNDKKQMNADELDRPVREIERKISVRHPRPVMRCSR
ncbi:CPSF A subunit region-domain-containing protein [Xylariales sp. AK1849]|nr:CPSF A subunit region-domain-containing protein [Xylariales sp. AK1849]